MKRRSAARGGAEIDEVDEQNAEVDEIDDETAEVDEAEPRGPAGGRGRAQTSASTGPVAKVGYFGSRTTALERNIGLGLAAVGVLVAIAGRASDVFDSNAKDHSTALPLVLVGVAASVLLAVAARYGRRVITAFAAILPGYFIVPARSSLAYVQFVFLAYAGWLMVKASNEASRSAAERRKQQGPRLTAAERAEARRAARNGSAPPPTGRSTPKASKRYTPPKPQKRRPAPPPEKAEKGKAKAKARSRGAADGDNDES